MLKKHLLIFIFSSSLVLLNAQDQNEVIWQSRTWVAKPMASQVMMEAMKIKTKKFNTGENAKNFPIMSFRILSGQMEGAIQRISYKSAEDWDTYSSQPEGTDFFRKKVIPLSDSDKSSGRFLAVSQDDHSYNGSGDDSNAKYSEVTRYLLKPGSNLKWNELRTKLVEAHQKAGSSARFSSFSITSGGLTPTFSLVVPFNSWSEYPSLLSTIFNQDAYDKAHGVGAWEKYLEVMNEIVLEREVFTREFLPELSSN